MGNLAKGSPLIKKLIFFVSYLTRAECHRSIYNVWSQVLTYFDAFIIGLTATPDKRTFAFFDENVVSEYTREQAIVDGVNVGEDIFLIETDVTKNGARLMKQLIEYRDRLSRTMRWQQMDEDEGYSGAKKSKLDKDVVNPSQIRTVIRTFKENLFTSLFPIVKRCLKHLSLQKPTVMRMISFRLLGKNLVKVMISAGK